MTKMERLYETKMQRAKRLPVGTWFVWPDVLPRQYKYYQPKVWCVDAMHRPIKSVFEDIGVWDVTHGPNTPHAVYDRACALAAELNAINADMTVANDRIKETRRASVRRASEMLGSWLSRIGNRDVPQESS